MPLPPWPTPPPPLERAQSVLGGELTLLGLPQGVAWQVGFASAFELVLRREGQLVGRRYRAEHQSMLLWAHQRLPALNAALETNLDLIVIEVDTPDGVPQIVPRDVWDRQRGALLDHASARDVLTRAHLAPPPHSLLGEVTSLLDLQVRMASLGAPGTRLEVRRHEGGLVAARAVLTVEVGRAAERR